MTKSELLKSLNDANVFETIDEIISMVNNDTAESHRVPNEILMHELKSMREMNGLFAISNLGILLAAERLIGKARAYLFMDEAGMDLIDFDIAESIAAIERTIYNIIMTAIRGE